ncbi:hypothetical protein GCM10009801_14270 [Streptomyces albiaxialis]|uniref:Cyclic nucleotide-binding domain-containing protein n=1 Tax=Streptomyces albiaxialis TaxID=329523 RepID=A0ABN2VNB5_9ACTN
MTTTFVRRGFLGCLAPAHRALLMEYAKETSFPADATLFEESAPADRFWVVRTGSVTLDVQVPGLGPGAVEILGPGELLGWSFVRRHRWLL